MDMLTGPEISRVVAEFEESLADEKVVTRHHEQTTHDQTGFAKDVNSLIPYMGKFWSGKKLANLVNCGLFTNILLANCFF